MFSQARQGRGGPRLPRIGTAALCGSLVGIGLAHFLYARIDPPAARDVGVRVPITEGFVAAMNEPPMMIDLRLGVHRDTRGAADLFGTMLRSVRMARERRLRTGSAED
jgi:hypothetical protein